MLHNYHRGEGPPGWVAKVDLKKLYDLIRWEVVRRMGVPEKFVKWVMLCVMTPIYSVMVNRAPYDHFRGKREILHGDPMSPYLFVLVMHLFTQFMRHSVKDGRFKLHYKCEDPENTPFFADDLIAFMSGDRETTRSFMGNL